MKRFIFPALVAVTLSVLGWVIFFAGDAKSGQAEEESSDILYIQAAQTETAAVQNPDSDPYLILINADNPLPEGFEGFTIVSAYRIVPISTSALTLEENTLDAIHSLFRAAREAGFDTLVVTDGYRSYERQEKTYSEAKDKSYVQLPGCSEHQSGLAADIGVTGVSSRDMEQCPEGQWLAENAWKYGFILRYPKDKTEITGISYEPWHFRYVGTEPAEYMYKNNLCLEEYLDLFYA